MCYFNNNDGTSFMAICDGTSKIREFLTPDCSGSYTTSLNFNVDGCTSPYFVSSFAACSPRWPPPPQPPTLCFSASESVALESGVVKLLPEVVVGDRVLAADATGTIVFADVVAVPHPPNSRRTQFIQVVTTSGKDLKLTAAHLLPAGPCDEVKACSASLQLVPASSVCAGMCVLTVDGVEEVAATRLIVGEGVYSLVTSEEMVVVSGVVASPFAVNHAVATAFYNMHRLFFRAFAPFGVSRARALGSTALCAAVDALAALTLGHSAA